MTPVMASYRMILHAIEERNEKYRSGTFPHFEYITKTPAIEPAKLRKHQLLPLPTSSQASAKFHKGCFSECFCHPKRIGTAQKNDRTELKKWISSDSRIALHISELPFHRRLNHGRTFTGVYKRHLNQSLNRSQSEGHLNQGDLKTLPVSCSLSLSSSQNKRLQLLKQTWSSSHPLQGGDITTSLTWSNDLRQ